MPEEDKGLVNDMEVGDAEDIRAEVTDVEVVGLDEEEVEEVEEREVVVVVVVVVEEDDVEEEEVEEEVEEEDVVPSSEAPFLTVKMSLTASWPAESIIWIS